MTVPSGGFPASQPGQPGSFGAPAQQPQQPQQQPMQPVQQAPSQPRKPADLGMILFLVTAALGLINLFLGFTPLATDPTAGESSNFFESNTVWFLALLFVSGLAALFQVLPGDQKPGAWPAIFAVGGVLPFLFVVFSSGADLSWGGILVLIFGFVQLIVAVVAYLFAVGVLKPAAPKPAGFGQQSQYGAQPAYGRQQFGQPSPYAPPGTGRQQAQPYGQGGAAEQTLYTGQSGASEPTVFAPQPPQQG